MFGLIRTLDQWFHLIDDCKQEFGGSVCFSLARALKSAEKYPPTRTVTLPNGFTVRCGGTDLWTFREVFFRHVYQCDGAPKTIIDCGANIGCSSVYFARRFPAARILAVEPDAGNFALLQRNAQPYPRVIRLQGAAWSSDGMVSFTDPDADPTCYAVTANAIDRRIPAFSIWSLIRKLDADRIDILKMDIEGAERAIFSGDTSWLDAVDILLIETHDRFTPGSSAAVYQAISRFPYRQEAREGNVQMICLNAAVQRSAGKSRETHSGQLAEPQNTFR